MNIFAKFSDVVERKQGVKDKELEELSEKEQKQGFLPLFAVWGGMTLTASAFYFGGLIIKSANLPTFLLVTVIGLAFAATVGSILALMSRKVGLSFTVASRYVYGNGGSALPAILLVATRIGWAAFDLSLVSVTVNLAIKSLTSFEPSLFATSAVFAVLFGLSALFGFSALKWVTYVAFILAIPTFIYGAGLAAAKTAGGLWAAFMAPPSDPMPLTALISITASMWIAGAITCGDWCRYGKSRGVIIGATFTSLIVIYAGFMFIGAVSTVGFGDSNIQDVMLKMGIIVPVALAFIVLIWSTIDNEFYSSGLGFSNIMDLTHKSEEGVAVPTYTRKPLWIVITVVITYIIANLGGGFFGHLYTFLDVLGVVIPPLGGIYIAEYALHRMPVVDNFRKIPFSVNLAAMIAWVVGAVVAWFVPDTFIPVILGLVVSLVVYLGLYAVGKNTGLYRSGLK